MANLLKDQSEIWSAILEQMTNGVIDMVVDFLGGLLGIDLSTLGPLLDELHLDFSSPAAFLGSLVHAITVLPEVLVTLLTTLIETLVSTDSSDLLNTLATALVTLLVSVPDLLTSLLTALVNMLTGLTGIDLSGLTELVSSLLSGNLVGALLGDDGFLQQLIQLVTQIPINAANLFGEIANNLLGNIAVSHIVQTEPNLLTAPTFDFVTNVVGATVWTFDSAVGNTSPGSVTIHANGTNLRLVSNIVEVIEGQQLIASVWAKWSGLTFTGTPMRLQMVRYLNHAVVGTDNLAVPVAPGANQAAFLPMTSSYTVPSGCDALRMQFYITNTATAGQVWFDDADLHKTGLMQQDWIQNLPADLQDLVAGIQNTIDTIMSAIARIPVVGGLIENLYTLLQNIPFLNVLGYGGPANIGDSFQASWDQLIGGLVGEAGTGSGLTDMFDIPQLISSWASLGRLGWDILGIRNNTPVESGYNSTAHSNINLSKIALQASPPTVALTSSASMIAFQRMPESNDINYVTWLSTSNPASGTVTDFRINLWEMDNSTGGMHLVNNATSNQASLISNLTDPQWATYTIAGGPIHVEAGDLIGVEFAMAGTGTINMAGATNWTPSHPSVYPKKLAATRTSGGLPVPTITDIASGSVVYANPTPYVELAKSATVPATPHSDEPHTYTSNGSQTIPVWCNYIDVIAIGGGGGGDDGSTFTDGKGGRPGVWASKTLTRGAGGSSGIPTSTTVLNIAVGAGGAHNEVPGSASSVTATGMTTLTAAGGPGGGAPDKSGAGAGDYTWPASGAHSVVYHGGGTSTGNGAVPGAGGAGGGWYGAWGFIGGTGRVWIVFRQT